MKTLLFTLLYFLITLNLSNAQCVKGISTNVNDPINDAVYPTSLVIPANNGQFPVDDSVCFNVPSIYWPQSRGANLSSYENLELSIYPNPSNGEMTIKSKTEIDKIEILNPFGEIKFTSLVNSTHSQVNLKNISTGFCFVKIYFSNGKYQIEKVIVQ